MAETSKTVYQRGAEDGLILGPVMAFILILSGVASYFPLAMFGAVIGAICVPSLVYVSLSRSRRTAGDEATLSALWLQGICAFFFGGLIMGMMVFVALRWVWPTFIFEQLDMAVEVLEASGDEAARQWVSVIQKARAEGLVPTAGDIVLELMYFVVFSGSLLSLILAWVVRLRHRPTPPPFNPQP